MIECVSTCIVLVGWFIYYMFVALSVSVCVYSVSVCIMHSLAKITVVSLNECVDQLLARSIGLIVVGELLSVKVSLQLVYTKQWCPLVRTAGKLARET